VKSSPAPLSTIQQGINYLKGIGTLYINGRTCSRISCFNGGAIYWCNDVSLHICGNRGDSTAFANFLHARARTKYLRAANWLPSMRRPYYTTVVLHIRIRPVYKSFMIKLTLSTLSFRLITAEIASHCQNLDSSVLC
jgi:hypothetical protein